MMIQKSPISQLNASTLIKYQFVAEVEFGVPSKKCKNFGICRIQPLGRASRENTGFQDANFSCSDSIGTVVTIFGDNSIEMGFLKYDIEQTKSYEHFAENEFLVEENTFFLLQDRPRIELKIKKGFYPVRDAGNLLVVLFKR